MAPVVSLQSVVDEMGILSEQHHAYLNKRTGELVSITDEEIWIVENDEDIDDYPGWQQDLIRQTQEVVESNDYLPLPSKFDIHEYAIMERFCYSVDDERLSDELVYLIRGRGAFRRFKDAIHRHGIADDWYQFRREALEEIAVNWLDRHHIEYTRESD